MPADTLGGGSVQGGTEGILDSSRNNSISAFLFGKQQQQTVKNIGFSIFSRKPEHILGSRALEIKR